MDFFLEKKYVSDLGFKKIIRVGFLWRNLRFGCGDLAKQTKGPDDDGHHQSHGFLWAF
jgi:hypothetical protein